jgi:hypothetical protein
MFIEILITGSHDCMFIEILITGSNDCVNGLDNAIGNKRAVMRTSY